MSNLTINKNKNSVHRALIFQGGGALGAYEAGIFKILHDKLIDKAEEENRPLFDIVAGTSAGAMNAVLLVNYVMQNQDKSSPWRGSADLLLQFWHDVTTSTWYLDNPFMHAFQDTAHFFREQSNKIWKTVS